jgi:hypothetical protein
MLAAEVKRRARDRAGIFILKGEVDGRRCRRIQGSQIDREKASGYIGGGTDYFVVSGANDFCLFQREEISP